MTTRDANSSSVTSRKDVLMDHTPFAPQDRPDPTPPEVPQCHLEAAARFKKLFVPVLYEAHETDSLGHRMLKKIYNIAATAKHRGDGLKANELRSIHSAAYAGIDGPEPDYFDIQPVVAAPARAHQEEKERDLARSGAMEISDHHLAASSDVGDKGDCAGTKTIDPDVVLDLATQLEATFDPGGNLPDDCEAWAVEHMDLIGKLRGLAESALMDDDEDFSPEEGD